MSLFEVQTKKPMGDDTKYSRAIRSPQYVPSDIKPNIDALCNYQKYAKLIANINKSNLPEEEKQFLRLAASRHIVFNYSLIADYYAHSDKEMQELMEQSALVIVDIEDAVDNGYVQLSKRMNQLIDEARANKLAMKENGESND